MCWRLRTVIVSVLHIWSEVCWHLRASVKCLRLIYFSHFDFCCWNFGQCAPGIYDWFFNYYYFILFLNPGGGIWVHGFLASSSFEFGASGLVTESSGTDLCLVPSFLLFFRCSNQWAGVESLTEASVADLYLCLCFSFLPIACITWQELVIDFLDWRGGGI